MPRGGKQILIIERDPAMGDMVKACVEGLGYAAVLVSTLDEGLAQVATQPFPLVFLGTTLPDGCWIEALPHIRYSLFSPEVICLAPSPSASDAEGAIRNGAWEYLIPPFSLEGLTAVARDSLAYGEGISKGDGRGAGGFQDIVGISPLIRSAIGQLRVFSQGTANVLIQGETGTGKELCARNIHDHCPHTPGNFVVVDCAALPETLTESILFGHAKGAFTGADSAAQGLVRNAHGGTLFLDEIGELPLSVQKAFLRVLQEKKFRPVGGIDEVESEFRLICATNRNLDEMVDGGGFRRDLFHRLKTFSLTLPPLKSRREDIGILAAHHLKKLCRIHGRQPPPQLRRDTVEALAAYDWPGNVRELINALEKALLSQTEGPWLLPAFLPHRIRLAEKLKGMGGQYPVEEGLHFICDPFPLGKLPSLKAYRREITGKMETAYLRHLLTLTRWNLNETARLAGVTKNRIYYLLRKYGISHRG